MPLLQKIRNLKYNETLVWHNDNTNTCNLIQNKYSIEKMSFTSSNDAVIEYNVSFLPAESSKRKIIIESESSELGSSEQEPSEPIYGDGLDGVKWNNPDYDKLWSNLPSGLRTGLITDREWMQEFMSNCVELRAQGKPCTFVTPKNLLLPPEIDPDGKVNFGINIYNQAYESLPADLKETYLTFYNEKGGVTDYTMLKNAMNDLVAKSVKFDRGLF